MSNGFNLIYDIYKLWGRIKSFYDWRSFNLIYDIYKLIIHANIHKFKKVLI